MKPNTQFKIETIEELIEFYKQNARDFQYPLSIEVEDFNKGNRCIACDSKNKIYLVNFERENFKTISNPMLKPRQEPIQEYKKLNTLHKAIEDFQKASKELGYRVGVVFESLD